MQDECEVFRVPEVRRIGELRVLGGGRNFGFNLHVAPHTESLGVPNFGGLEVAEIPEMRRSEWLLAGRT